MPSVVTSLLLALGQLGDPRVLRVLAKSVAVTLVLFGAIAWGAWHALDFGLDRAGLDQHLFAGADGMRQAAALVLTLLGLWLLWRIVAMAVIEFFADEVVLAVEARHYPQAAERARDGEQEHSGIGQGFEQGAWQLARCFDGVGVLPDQGRERPGPLQRRGRLRHGLVG